MSVLRELFTVSIERYDDGSFHRGHLGYGWLLVGFLGIWAVVSLVLR